MATNPGYAAPRSGAPVSIPLTSSSQWWIPGTVLLCLLIYYYIHEFVHDARHFLGFPCH
jgi:hypothetical protein